MGQRSGGAQVCQRAPGWEFFLPDNVPWPTPGFGVEIGRSTRTSSGRSARLGPAAQTGRAPPLPHPMSALGTMAAKGPACVAIPTCRRPSYWAPPVTSRPARWHAGPPDTHAKASARPTCTEPWPAAGRHPQRGHRGLSPPQSPEPSRPQTERPTAEPQPPRSAAVPWVTPARASTRGTQAPGGAPARRRSGSGWGCSWQLPGAPGAASTGTTTWRRRRATWGAA